MATTNGNRPAPSDEHAEAALLGLALLAPEAAAVVATQLTPEDFYGPAHQLIAAAVAELVVAGSHVDRILIESHLGPKRLEAAGGDALVADLIIHAGLLGSVDSYAHRILDARRRRQVLGLAYEVIDAAYDGDPSRKLEQLSSIAGDGPRREFTRTELGSLIRDGVPAPTMVHAWLYAGGLHAIQSEPGVGKTMVVLWLAVQQITAGWSVIYMDEEGGEELVAERLAALGADPDLVDRLFFYFPFPGRRWTPADMAALAATIKTAEQAGPLSMGVFDSLPDFLAAAAMNEDSSMDVTTFAQRLLTPFREVGAALVVLDHTTKPEASSSAPRKKKEPSRYGRGSGAKLAKTHATLLIETGEPFDRSHSGQIHLWATKDRRGFLELPHPKDPPLVLDVIVADGTLRFEVGEMKPESLEAWSGPTHCMDDIVGAFPAGSWLNTSQVCSIVAYKRQTILDGLRVLSESGRLMRRPAKRGAIEYALPDDATPVQEQF